MKKISMAAILMALVLGGSISCTKDNSGTSAVSTASITNTGNGNNASNGSGGGGPAIGNTRAILEGGTWKITAFSDGQQPVSYTGYAFNFVDDGSATITFGAAVYNGSWATSAERQDILHMDFGAEPAEIAALNGDWKVANISSTLIQFQRYNGKGSFTFEKM